MTRPHASLTSAISLTRPHASLSQDLTHLLPQPSLSLEQLEGASRMRGCVRALAPDSQVTHMKESRGRYK